MKTLCSALLGISLLLSACGGAAPAETTPTPDPQSVLTAAAVTAQARMTEQAAQTPTAPPATATDTPVPPTPTATGLATGAAATTAAPPAGGGGTDRLEFVADLTVPDGTVFAPGEKFTKTWRLKNSGTSTWTTAYALVFSSGEQMGGAASTPLPAQVPPGQTVDLSVQLTAPSAAGNYTGFWLLRNAAGTNFGLGPNADGAFYVQINVSATAATSTAGPSPTAGSSNGDTVTAATLSVDEADVEEACPYTYTFTASFTLSKAATVTYQLEVEAGIPLNLPGPTTASLNAGTSQVTYTLELTASVSGTAVLHITSPEDVTSDPLAFTLTCQ